MLPSDIGAAAATRTLRVVSLIRQEEKRHGNFHKLASAINAANSAKNTGLQVNHQTLKKIANAPERCALRYNLLMALDTYFTDRGESLADLPLLEKRGIIECLVNARRIVFLLGSRPRKAEQRHYLSRWDTRSLAELLSASCKFDVHINYAIEDVLLRPAFNAELVRKEKWHDLLTDGSSSLIAIGSPLACLASEVMLAKMFGVPPFQSPDLSLSDKQRLPFFYAWPPNKAPRFRSAFALDARQLAKFNRRPARALQENRIAAFVLDQEVFEVPRHGNRWTMYGVIAAQRREEQSVWLVVSGLSGPATFGAAMHTKRITAELPWKKDAVAPVLWVPIEASIVADESLGSEGDNRELVSVKALSPPRLWHPLV